MRIAFLIQSMKIGGSQRVTANLANHFASIGWTVIIIVLSQDNVSCYKLDQRIKLYSTSLDRKSNNTLTAIINNITRFMVIRSLVIKYNLDCIVGMGSTTNVIVAISCVGLSVVTIGSERSHPEHRNTNFAWRFLRSHTYKYLDVLHCQTKTTQRWLLTNTNVKEIHVIPNGLALPLPMENPYINPKSIMGENQIILSVGRLIESKQFEQAIDIFSDVSKEFPDWILVIAGEGPQRHKLEEKVLAYGLEHKIFLPGSIGNLGDWYNSSSIFLFLSRLEGFPNSLLEAMGHGLACISYDCKAGPSELLQHQISGELVELNNQKEAKRSLKKVIANKSYRENISNTAKRHADKYSTENISVRWVSVIENALKNK